MSGLSFGLLVEGGVALLLALTIGYCIVLNARLKRLHADKDMLREMIADLVGATTLANQAIKELKETAVETDLSINAKLEEAERFGIELANHVNAGTVLMERIARITSVARASRTIEPVEEPGGRARDALDQLNARLRERGNAA